MTEWRRPYQRGDEINAGHVVDVLDLEGVVLGGDSLLPARLDAGLEDVGVVKVLHGLRAEVDAEVLQLGRLGVLESEHVEDPDEAVGGGAMHRVVEKRHRLARLARTGRAHRRRDVTGNLTAEKVLGQYESNHRTAGWCRVE